MRGRGISQPCVQALVVVTTQRRRYWHLLGGCQQHPLPSAAVTNDHKLSGLEHQFVTLLYAKAVQKVPSICGWAPGAACFLGAPGVSLCPCLFQRPELPTGLGSRPLPPPSKPAAVASSPAVFHRHMPFPPTRLVATPGPPGPPRTSPHLRILTFNRICKGVALLCHCLPCKVTESQIPGSGTQTSGAGGDIILSPTPGRLRDMPWPPQRRTIRFKASVCRGGNTSTPDPAAGVCPTCRTPMPLPNARTDFSKM